MIAVVEEQVSDWRLSAVVFRQEQFRVGFPVHATIGNSVSTSPKGKALLLEWKRAVAAVAKQARGAARLDPGSVYSISAGFSFFMPSHGEQRLDVENFVKPTMDGLAAGLFCESTVDCRQLDRFAYDDTGFKYLFLYRLPDAGSAKDEGVGFVVSIHDPSSQSA